MRFEEGKYYRYLRDEVPKGGHKFVLDHKPHRCIFCNKDGKVFFEGDPENAYRYWGDSAYDMFWEEVIIQDINCGDVVLAYDNILFPKYHRMVLLSFMPWKEKPYLCIPESEYKTLGLGPVENIQAFSHVTTAQRGIDIAYKNSREMKPREFDGWLLEGGNDLYTEVMLLKQRLEKITSILEDR